VQNSVQKSKINSQIISLKERHDLGSIFNRKVTPETAKQTNESSSSSEEYIQVMLKKSAAFNAYDTIMLWDRKSLFFFPGNALFRQRVINIFTNK
jgi:hypothetical protein